MERLFTNFILIKAILGMGFLLGLCFLFWSPIVVGVVLAILLFGIGHESLLLIRLRKLVLPDQRPKLTRIKFNLTLYKITNAVVIIAIASSFIWLFCSPLFFQGAHNMDWVYWLVGGLFSVLIILFIKDINYAIDNELFILEQIN